MAERRKRGRPRRKRREQPPELGAGLEAARSLARKRFGIQRLHPLQVQALEAVFAGRDTLAVLPTGYGKSLLYQLPALLAERPTVVVSPLIALMVDQEASLRRRGAPVVRIDSSLRVAERRAALARLEEGGRLIVLTTPETLESEGARGAFARARPWLMCVDEAHCISEWGHDFRPAYLRLGVERKALGGPQVLALTATATPRVRDDIAKRLKLKRPAIVQAPPGRANLRLEVEDVSVATKDERAGRLIRRLPRPGIVYCSTTVAAEAFGKALERGRIPSARYHGRRTKAERETAQKRFMQPSKKLVMCATSAFGMGIDKPNIRFVLHYQCPGSLEQYVQEAGRAGRDGKPSRCILLYDPRDLEIQRHLQKQGRATGPQIERVASALTAWAGDERPVAANDLALSASVSQTITRSVCAQLEEVGALMRDSRKRLHVAVAWRELARVARDLARRLATQEREDEERLLVMDAYARTPGCRSAFLRRYFGEKDPPDCGNCDRCRIRPPRRERRKKQATNPRSRKRDATPEGTKKKPRRRRRRRRADP
ncbi:MAG: ATP-dependent DNA helicase RecQ [bacterium]|nr:ATP-dependent DNA helicase RecQ [bacterium]